MAEMRKITDSDGNLLFHEWDFSVEELQVLLEQGYLSESMEDMAKNCIDKVAKQQSGLLPPWKPRGV